MALNRRKDYENEATEQRRQGNWVLKPLPLYGGGAWGGGGKHFAAQPVGGKAAKNHFEQQPDVKGCRRIEDEFEQCDGPIDQRLRPLLRVEKSIGVAKQTLVKRGKAVLQRIVCPPAKPRIFHAVALFRPGEVGGNLCDTRPCDHQPYQGLVCQR